MIRVADAKLFIDSFISNHKAHHYVAKTDVFWYVLQVFHPREKDSLSKAGFSPIFRDQIILRQGKVLFNSYSWGFQVC